MTHSFRMPSWILALLTILIPSSELFAADTKPAQDLVELEQHAIKAATARVAPSVVRIETLGGLERVGDVLLSTGPTTGTVVSSDGYIISSAFNFAQKPASILVTLADGQRLPAKLIATDHNRMLVLLKVEAKGPLQAPEAVCEQDIRPGQWSIAMGRTFDPAVPNISVGIVSATERIWNKAIQTDAKISPNNYGGPLVDIQGRVLGVLVPLSPQSTGAMAGAEWYDSGIGFAVSLEDINAVLPRLREGQDLRQGLLGIVMRGSDIYADVPVIAATAPGSPAREAGLRKGDQIVTVNGQAVARQSELKHQVSSLYAGDHVVVTVLRDGKKFEHSLDLVAKIPPYAVPFLGILPERGKEEVIVWHVFPSSPAEAAGLQAGDHIKMAAGQPIKKRQSLLEVLAEFAPGEEISLEVARAGEPQPIKLHLGEMPAAVPEEVPLAAETKAAGGPGVGAVELKLPELQNKIFAFVPDDYDAAVPHGLVVHLHEAGNVQDQALFDRWKSACAQRNLILLSPRAADAARWQRTEVEFIRAAIEDVTKKYNVDRSRIVVFGEGAGGGMAYLAAFANRGLISGVAVSASPLPAGLEPPATHPLERLFVYSSVTAVSAESATQASVDRLRSMKYPVTVAEAEDGKLNDEQFTELVRWIDSVDRL